jgi:type VI secretion system protein ImpA
VLADLRAIVAAMASHAAPFTDLDPAIHLAEQIATRMRALEAKLGNKASSTKGATELASPSAHTSKEEAAQPPSPPGAIRGPDDVLIAIDRICEYYEKYERSSPVPLLLQRARGLVNRSFVEAVRDLAAKGIPDLDIVIGTAAKAK